MSRFLLIICLLAIAGVTVPVVLFAQAPKGNPSLGPFKLDVDKKIGTIDIDMSSSDPKKQRMVCEKNVVLVSPKKPPYTLEIRCQRLEANGVTDMTTTSITATGAVTFTFITPAKPTGAAAAKAPYVYHGKAEKMIIESAIAPGDTKATRTLRLLKAKDANGAEVQSLLEFGPEDGKKYRATGDSIIYNIDTGKGTMGNTIESVEDEP